MLFTNAVLKELQKLIWILNNINNTASPLIKMKGIKIKELHVQRKLSSLFARKINIIVDSYKNTLPNSRSDLSLT